MAAIRWLADENFNNDVTRALLRRRPDLDIVRANEAGLAGRSNPEVLALAPAENRVILTHDVSTMTAGAYERIAAGEAMPGIAEAGEDILLITDCSSSR